MKVAWALPASSPDVMGIWLPKLSALLPQIITGMLKFVACAFIAMLGYGMGMGDGAAGVRHTSGKPMF